jgi:hypothetical protein
VGFFDGLLVGGFLQVADEGRYGETVDKEVVGFVGLPVGILVASPFGIDERLEGDAEAGPVGTCASMGAFVSNLKPDGDGLVDDLR